MTVTLDRADGIATVTLDRPDALNALNTALLNELADALEAWDRGSDVRCIIVTGSERAFAAGADVSCGGGPLRPPHARDRNRGGHGGPPLQIR